MHKFSKVTVTYSKASALHMLTLTAGLRSCINKVSFILIALTDNLILPTLEFKNDPTSFHVFL